MGTNMATRLKYKVFNNNILVTAIMQEEKVKSAKGIELARPNQYEDKASSGKVVLSGDEAFAIGDIVFFSQYAPITLTLEGEEYLVLRKEDIILGT